MRKWIKIISCLLLIAGGVVLCAVRWQAWFAMPPEPEWTGDTLTYVFPNLTGETDLTSNSPKDDLTILVLGDIHNRLTREDYDTLAARVPNADLVIQTGDWMERGYNYYYQSLLQEWTNSELMGLPVIACPGNHDYSKGPFKTLSPVWEKAFFDRRSMVNGLLTDVPGISYYVDIASMRLIVLDTNPLTRLVDLTRTLTWLREAMYSAGDHFIVMLMHHPVLSPGQGRFNPLIYATFRYALSQADLVIAGHDHSYMRRSPFVVLNTAGRPKPQHFGFHADHTDTDFVYGVLQLSTIDHQSSMELRIFNLDNGALLDSLYVTHD